MRYLQILAVLLLCAAWATAQEDTTRTTPTPASPSQSSPTAAQTTADNGASETTVQGCLSGSAGSYLLTDKSGVTYQLSSDSSNAKMSEYVGQEVQITGTGSAGSPASSTGNSASGMGHATTSSQALQVSSVKFISKTCSK